MQSLLNLLLKQEAVELIWLTACKVRKGAFDSIKNMVMKAGNTFPDRN